MAANMREFPKIEHDGLQLTLPQWAARLGITRTTLRCRLLYLSVSEAFQPGRRPPRASTKPPRPNTGQRQSWNVPTMTAAERVECAEFRQWRGPVTPELRGML